MPDAVWCVLCPRKVAAGGRSRGRRSGAGAKAFGAQRGLAGTKGVQRQNKHPPSDVRGSERAYRSATALITLVAMALLERTKGRLTRKKLRKEKYNANLENEIFLVSGQ